MKLGSISSQEAVGARPGLGRVSRRCREGARAQRRASTSRVGPTGADQSAAPGGADELRGALPKTRELSKTIGGFLFRRALFLLQRWDNNLLSSFHSASPAGAAESRDARNAARASACRPLRRYTIRGFPLPPSGATRARKIWRRIARRGAGGKPGRRGVFVLT